MIATSHGTGPRPWLLLTLLITVGCQTLPGDAPGTAPRDGRVPAKPAATEQPDASIHVEQKVPAVEPGPTSTDLWPLLRASFRLERELDQPRVRAELEEMLRYPDHLQRFADRLQLFLPHVFQAVQARGFPGELALLPILESAMDPQAGSIGGPAGLWQILPATAARLDIPRDWWFEGRHDPVIATRAALDYLDYLHNRFGDWRLAIVSYNAGEGTVMRALEGQGAAAGFWSLRLPDAGMVYVPKLFALAEIVADPARYGVDLPPLNADAGFVTLPTGGQVEIGTAARAIELDADDLYRLNPGLNRNVTPPAGPHLLHVPTTREEPARQWLANLTPEQRVARERIRVRTGDTLGMLARRHATDTRTLRALNNLADDRLRAGQYLFVPARDAADGSPGVAHVVRAGETLWGIARSYRVTLDALIANNGLRRDAVLRVGQRITIPASSGGR